MISDDELYTLAIFLGCASMILIVLYHFLEVNAHDEDAASQKTPATAATQATVGAQGPSSGSGKQGATTR